MKYLIFIGLVIGLGAGPDDLLAQSVGVIIFGVGAVLCRNQVSA